MTLLLAINFLLVSFPSLRQSTWSHQLKKRKGIFQFKVLEVSAHDQLTSLLWACGDTAHEWKHYWSHDD
jgi:hypothetical protein